MFGRSVFRERGGRDKHTHIWGRAGQDVVVEALFGVDEVDGILDYRHIDTAQSYFNESEVGDGIKAGGIDRKELFVTTKVWLEHYGYEQTLKSVEVSLKKLKTDYLDLLLLHQPYSDVHGSWRALEKLYRDGVVRAIGVSN